MPKAEAARALEAALAVAVRAALPLPQMERPAFIGRHLLASIDDSQPTPQAPAGSSSTVEALGLAALSELLTRVVNTANAKRDESSWPIRSVGLSLSQMTRDDAGRLFATIADGGSAQDPEGIGNESSEHLGSSFLTPFGDVFGSVEFQELKASRDNDDPAEHAAAVATAAFRVFHADVNSGQLDKQELFKVLIELGLCAPVRGSEKEKEKALESQFLLADVNGDGAVDFGEFVAFYLDAMEAVTCEASARDAFSRYDVDESNSLEKHELFQALLDLDLVPQGALAQKRAYLEEQFCLADTNGDGVVDFGEFVAFYIAARKASMSSVGVHLKRHKAQEAALERARRSAAYVEVGTLFNATRAGDVPTRGGRSNPHDWSRVSSPHSMLSPPLPSMLSPLSPHLSLLSLSLLSLSPLSLTSPSHLSHTSPHLTPACSPHLSPSSPSLSSPSLSSPSHLSLTSPSHLSPPLPTLLSLSPLPLSSPSHLSLPPLPTSPHSPFSLSSRSALAHQPRARCPPPWQGGPRTSQLAPQAGGLVQERREAADGHPGQVGATGGQRGCAR